MTSDNSGSLADDILAGVDAIAAFIGKEPRKVYYMLSRGQIPGAFKYPNSKIWHGRKSTLLRRHDSMEKSASGAV